MNKTGVAAAASILFAAILPTAAIAQQSDVINVYTSQPTNQMSEVIDAFHKDYPRIRVELYRSGTTEVMNKLQAEFAAGKVQADIVLLADAIAMTRLKNDGRLLTYKDAPTNGLPASVIDPDKTFFGTKLITTGIVYNTRLIKTPPTSWHDLTPPRAAAGTVMPSPLYSGAAAIYVGSIIQQPGFGWDYFKMLSEEGAIAVQGNGAVIDAVAQGEKAYGVLVDYMAMNAKAKGSPVGFAFPSEGVAVVTQPVAILKGSHNPEDAKRFVDWQLSRAAQQQSVAQGYYPILPSIAPPKGYPPIASVKVLPADYARILANDNENKQQFSKLFGG